MKDKVQSNTAMPASQGHNVTAVTKVESEISSGFIERSSTSDKFVISSKEAKRVSITYNVGASERRRANRIANGAVVYSQSTTDK